MRNDYKAENIAKYIDDFVRHAEHFDNIFFTRLSCMFTTLALMCNLEADTHVCDDLILSLWNEISVNCNLHYTSEDYDAFYNLMVQWIV